VAILVVGFLPSTTHPVSSAPSTTTGLIVPLYTYPTNLSWSSLIKERLSYPNVPIIAVVNPDSGLGKSLSPIYATGIAGLQKVGIVVVGYVPTGYASVKLETVDASALDYKSWYNVSGIFFDQMSNSPSEASYYSMASQYANSIGLGLTVGNPGTSVPPSDVGTVSIRIIYEDAGLPSVSTIANSTLGAPRGNFAAISYDVASPSQSYLQSVTQYLSYVYFTNKHAPDPYAGLPSYLGSLMKELSSLDGSSTTTTTTGALFN
jgi:Spherulation-specific family 4